MMKMGMTVTLNKLHKNSGLVTSYDWEKLLKYLNKTQPDDEPLPIITILDNNHLINAVWALRSIEGYDREIRLYAVWCARQVQHLMSDPRSLNALNVAERYATGLATIDELREAESLAKNAQEAILLSAFKDRTIPWPAAEAAVWTVNSDAGLAVWGADRWALTAAGVKEGTWNNETYDEACKKHEIQLREMCGNV